VRSTLRQSIGILLVIALGNCAFAGELGLAPIAIVEPAEAIRYAWISGLCATLALVFSFLWVATGQKAFGWYLGMVLAAGWRIGENSGQLPVLFPESGHALATVSHVLADSALLYFTVGLLLQALGRQAADLPYRRILYAAGLLSLVLAALAPWPLLAPSVLPGGLALAYGVLLLLTAWLALRGRRVFLWYCMGLLVPLVSLYLQQALGVGTVLLSSYRIDNALVQGLVVLAGALAYQEVRQRQSHMRELRGLLQEQNLALEKARQAEIDLESQVSQRTQELAMAARRLEALSTVDGMTGVANRRRFDETLQVEWGRAARDKRPLSVALIDVDWFKGYNDRYGHPAGDACLRQLARVFEAGVMRSGDLIARYGGEEFVLIAPDTDLNGIYTIASYLCQEVFALALEHEDSPYGRVSVSIGVATGYPHRGSKPLQLVQQADSALYRAKQQGRHRVAGPEGENEKA
jgi:diguanylate cyclase (GGDEF)-like protein